MATGCGPRIVLDDPASLVLIITSPKLGRHSRRRAEHPTAALGHARTAYARARLRQVRPSWLLSWPLQMGRDEPALKFTLRLSNWLSPSFGRYILIVATGPDGHRTAVDFARTVRILVRLTDLRSPAVAEGEGWQDMRPACRPNVSPPSPGPAQIRHRHERSHRTDLGQQTRLSSLSIRFYYRPKLY